VKSFVPFVVKDNT